jgi:hypothetical protein
MIVRSMPGHVRAARGEDSLVFERALTPALSYEAVTTVPGPEVQHLHLRRDGQDLPERWLQFVKRERRLDGEQRPTFC